MSPEEFNERMERYKRARVEADEQQKALTKAIPCIVLEYGAVDARVQMSGDQFNVYVERTDGSVEDIYALEQYEDPHDCLVYYCKPGNDEREIKEDCR